MDPTPDGLEPVEPATHEPVQPESTTAQPSDSTSTTTSATTSTTTSAAAAKVAAAKAAAAAKRANAAERTTPGNAGTLASQSKPAAAPAKAKPSQRQRLSRFIAIGALMVAVAVAGYLLLGPDGQIARSGHQRPADVATHRPTGSAKPAAPTTADGAVTAGAGDLDAMRTEMQTITAQVNAILGDVQVTATTTSGYPAVPTVAPAVVPGGE